MEIQSQSQAIERVLRDIGADPLFIEELTHAGASFLRTIPVDKNG
jgi:hypothetical protein